MRVNKKRGSVIAVTAASVITVALLAGGSPVLAATSGDYVHTGHTGVNPNAASDGAEPSQPNVSNADILAGRVDPSLVDNGTYADDPNYVEDTDSSYVSLTPDTSATASPSPAPTSSASSSPTPTSTPSSTSTPGPIMTGKPISQAQPAATSNAQPAEISPALCKGKTDDAHYSRGTKMESVHGRTKCSYAVPEVGVTTYLQKAWWIFYFTKAIRSKVQENSRTSTDATPHAACSHGTWRGVSFHWSFEGGEEYDIDSYGPTDNSTCS